MSPHLPTYDPKRQADAVVLAYQYQFLETAIAWLELGASETLLVEVAEDFDVQTEDGRVSLTQITHTSTERRLTLASKKSREALANFWAASNRGTDPLISLVLHTNMAAGREASCEFPDGQLGIEYWRQVQSGADPLPLRDALRVALKPGLLRDWIEAEPDLGVFVEKLVNRITWRMAQKAGPERTAMLTALLKARLSALGLPLGFAGNATKLLIYRILETASNPAVGLRRLKASNLNSFLHEVVRPGQPGHETQWGLASWTSPLDTLPLPRICAARDSMVSSLKSQLEIADALWLHGASGTGKSTLAQQTAARAEGTWLLVDFRNQDQPTEILNRLERLYTDVTLTEQSVGVILDDVKPDLMSENAPRFSMLLEWLKSKRRSVIVTSAQAPSPALVSNLGLKQASIIEAPYLELADVSDMARATGAPIDMIEAWSLFIHVATTQGHPQLSAAKVASLAFRSWPRTALTEDIMGQVSEAVKLTRAEARQRLLREATHDGRALLKRLACIFLKFDRPMAIAAASVDPAIPDPSASLDFLIGPWIEYAPGSSGFFRLSPLLHGLNEDLRTETKEAVHSSVVIKSIQRGPIPFEALDVVVWNAILGRQGWFFVKFFETLMKQSAEENAAMASKLSTIVFLPSDRPIFSNDPIASIFVRLIQLDVAAINRDDHVFQAVAEAALREADLLDVEEAKQGMHFMALSKILFAIGGRLDWVTRLTWLEDYDAISKTDPILRQQAEAQVLLDLKKDFGEDADLPGFLLTIGLQTIQSPDDLQELFNALDCLSEEARKRWLDQLRAYSGKYDLYIQSAWANASFGGNLTAEMAIAAYENMEGQAKSWAELPLAHECVIAQSVLWDEFQNDRTRALTVVDNALEVYPKNSALLRQKAKVLGHDGHYKDARTILAALKSELDQRSSVEQLYVLKEEAVAAAKLGDFADAHYLFLQAASAGNELIEDMFDLKCHKIALRAEAALCSWWLGEQSHALILLAAVLEETGEIDPGASDTARILHVNMRWLTGWIDRSTQAPQGDPPPELVPGAISALGGEVTDEHLVDRGPFDDVKLLLLISARRLGLPDVDLEINWSMTTPGFHLFLVGAEFDLAAESKQPGQIATAILNIAAAFLVAADAKNGITTRTPLPIQNGGDIKLADAGSVPIRTVLGPLIALVAFRQRREASGIRGLISQIVAALEKRLGEDETLFVELRNALDRNGARPASHAGQVISDLLEKEDGTLHPARLIHYHLNLAALVVSSGAGVRTAHDILTATADDWNYVIERQRFLISQPALTTLQLKRATEQVRNHEPGALRELLDAAARGLRSKIPEEWQTPLERLGGRK